MQCTTQDSIAVSLFGSGQNKNTTSHHQIDGKIKITNLRRGPCLHCSCAFVVLPVIIVILSQRAPGGNLSFLANKKRKERAPGGNRGRGQLNGKKENVALINWKAFVSPIS